MTVEKPLWLGPHPTTGETPEYDARADRQILATLFTEGVGNLMAGELAVTQRAAGAAMSVDVAAGAAYITGDDIARQGLYRCAVTGTESVAIAAAPASGSRIDLIVLRVYDAQAITSTKHGAYLEVVQGVAAGSPVAPALPPTAVPLAQVLVAAGATSVMTASITDRRGQSGAAKVRIDDGAASAMTFTRVAGVITQATETRPDGSVRLMILRYSNDRLVSVQRFNPAATDTLTYNAAGYFTGYTTA